MNFFLIFNKPILRIYIKFVFCFVVILGEKWYQNINKSGILQNREYLSKSRDRGELTI